MLPERVLRLVDLLVLLLALLLLVQALAMGGASGLLPLATLGCVAVIVAGWVLWRRTARRWGLLIVGLASCAAAAASGGSGVGTVAVIVGIALVTLGYGAAAGLGTLLLVVLADLVLMLTQRHLSAPAAVVELVGSFLLLGLGVILGRLLGELAAERARNAALVDEVRHAAITEQELMLADERARSARELHDGLGHQLTLVGLGLEYADRMWQRDPDSAHTEVLQARRTAVDALAHMRRWVRALNPPRSEALGNDGFEAIARSFRGTGLDVRVEHRGVEAPLGQAASLFALRMVQEGLTNVVRHSEADQVVLQLVWRPSQLELRLRDNGGGGAVLVPGFGLRSLAERADALGGQFRATSGDDGVELVATVGTGEAR